MIVIRDVPDRFHGFLSSVMLEVSPNVFVSPHMNPGVRARVWEVMSDWHGHERQGSLVMVWRDLNATGGVGIANLGEPATGGAAWFSPTHRRHGSTSPEW